MKKILFMLTESFPFKKNAEAFLEPEIQIVSSFFDEVYICPSSIGNNYEEKRDIEDENIYINPVERENLLVELIKSVPYLLKHRGFWQDVGMLMRNGLIFNISALKKLIYTILTESAIVRHYNKVQYNFEKDAAIFIYSYWMFGEAGGAIAIKQSIKNKRKIVFSRGHGTDIVGYDSIKSYSPLKKYYLDNLDFIYPISEKGKSVLIEQYEKYNFNSDIIANKIVPVYLGIEDFSREDRYKPTKLFTIVSCSSVIPVKRVNLIVEALSHISSKKIRWIHLGDGNLLNDVKRECDEKLGDNILFEFKGALSRNDVLNFYNTNDINLFINVSSSEGIPVSIMEAFSFGIPTIATNVGGTSELCQDRKNGFLLPIDFQPTELTNLICEVINLVEKEPEKYLLLRRAARKTVLEKFSTENLNSFYENIMEKVIEDL